MSRAECEVEKSQKLKAFNTELSTFDAQARSVKVSQGWSNPSDQIPANGSGRKFGIARKSSHKKGLKVRVRSIIWVGALSPRFQVNGTTPTTPLPKSRIAVS